MDRKVLFLTNEYPPHVYGGAGIHVKHLTDELAAHIGIDVRCFGDQELRDGNLVVQGFSADPDLFSRSPAGLKSAISAIHRSVAFSAHPTDADLVHAHTWYTHLGGILIKLGYAIPLVVTTHSLEPLRPWKQEQLGTGYRVSTWLEKSALEAADAIIAVSRDMRSDILRLFDVDEEKIHVIYNGIDIDQFKPLPTTGSLRKLGVDPEKPYLLFVGRITRQKGIAHLIDAIPFIDPRVQVVLVAGQPDTEQIGAEVEGKIRKLQGERPHVVWIREWVDTEAKIELYSHAAVFCCPSVYEPFGIINLEAMACEIPVVATAVGGIKEIVEDGKTGYLVEFKAQPGKPSQPEDPEGLARKLAEKIDRIALDASLKRRMGQAGRRRAESLFSWKAVARQHLDLYEKVVALSI